jgi:tetratricopeptide (TPR) repeat protein
MTEPSNLTLDEILSIHGNRAAYDVLVSSLSEGEAIAFVGAGASAGMYPLWNQFIESLADHAVAEGKATPRDAARWKADTNSSPQQRVNVIVRKLGEPRYRNFLKESFAPRRGSDGKPYTVTHAALLRLPFSGYVTTNYDPALDYARADLRPDSLTTGTPTWRDDEEVYRWYTGDIFGRAGDCPILWLHGYWQRPNDIVLNSGEYSAAYKPGLYRNLFNGLWGQRHLVFVGFGFNDPQFTFMVGEYLRDLRDINALPRHVALLGMPVGEDGRLPDAEAVNEWRDNLEADYHVRPLFYPVRDGDHSALQVLLDAVAAERGVGEVATDASATPPATPASAMPAPSAFRAKWFHEPSNDDKFLGRDDELARLDRWVRDEAVHAIGVSAVGGTGKTALAGHWLKNTGGWRTRPFAGLFAWSFYQNRDTANFLFELLLWAHEEFGTSEPDEDTDLVDAGLDLTRRYALVVVLDGLEVLQEGQEEARHGTFLDSDLREFLTALCRRESQSLAVLTSRFVFADLERFLGTNFHQLELHGLAPERGAELLYELKVGGPTHEREHVSDRLDGHPLGLRVFAGALPDEDRDEPRRFLDHVFRPDELPEGALLNDKLRRLLVFYEKRLTPTQSRLLSIVSLFRTPVADETVLRLARGLFGRKKKEPLPDDATLAAELNRLHLRGILSREPIESGYGSACHPILRDHFRSLLLRAGTTTARRAADLLKRQPSEERPQSVKEIEPVLLAIELLLDTEDFEAADELYMSRLNQGVIFRTIPAPTEGLACALGFVKTEARRRQCEGKLTRRLVSFYLNEVGICADQSGHYEMALRYYHDSSAIDREMQNVKNLSTGLQNESELIAILGRLAEARHISTEALQLATQEYHEWGMLGSRTYRGWIETLSGQIHCAAEDFAIANEIEKKNDPIGDELHSLRGIQWAELLLRGGHPIIASHRTQANLRVCESEKWNADISRCHWILGWCALAEGLLDDAESELRQAEPTFHRGQLLFNLARLHIAAGELALERGQAEGALDRAAEALALGAPRGMRLVHADALVLRGRARMLEGRDECAGRVLDDAEEALRIARECGYVWAERDGLFLKAEAHDTRARAHQAAGSDAAATREREASRRARANAEALALKLVLTKEDLAAAEAKAVAWMKEWEEKGKEKDAEDEE